MEITTNLRYASTALQRWLINRHISCRNGEFILQYFPHFGITLFLVWTDSSSENFAGWNTSGKRTCRPSVRHRIASSNCRPPRPLSHPLLFYARRICALSICQTCRDWISFENIAKYIQYWFTVIVCIWLCFQSKDWISKFGGYYIWERVANIDKFTIICWVKVDVVKRHVIIE